MASRLMQQVRSNWSRTLLICRKCSKKMDGGSGPGGKRPLAKALRRHLGVKNGRKAPIGVVEVGCLGVCPKDAVAVVDAAAPARWRIVPAHTPIEQVVKSLALRDRPGA